MNDNDTSDLSDYQRNSQYNYWCHVTDKPTIGAAWDAAWSLARKQAQERERVMADKANALISAAYGAAYCAAKGWDHCLLQNEREEIAEAYRAFKEGKK